MAHVPGPDQPDQTGMYELEFPAPQLSTADGRGPVLVHALEGFSDAGHAIRLAAKHLRDVLDTELVASFAIDELLDYRSRRPLMTFKTDHFTSYEDPELSLYALNVIDRVTLARTVGLAEAGLYALAVKFSQVVTVVVRAFNLAWPPLAYSIRDDDDARRAYSLVVTYYLLLSFTIVLGLSLEARWIARALAAPEFFDSYQAVPLVSTGVTLYALYLVLSVAIGRTGRTYYNFPVTAAALACNVVLNLVLVPPYGIVGAGIALVVSYLLMVGLMYLVTRRVFPLGLEWGRIARIVGFAAALFAGAELLLPTSGAVGFLLRAALLPVYWALLYFTGFFHDAELEQLRAIRARARELLSRSGESPQDLEALRSRSDLVDEVHDA